MSENDIINLLFPELVDLTNEDDSPEQTPGPLNQAELTRPDLILQQPVALRPANITAEGAAAAQQILAAEYPGPADRYSPPIVAEKGVFEPPFSRISTPELPEGGPEFHEAITQTKEIQEIMQGSLQHRRFLAAAREVVDEHLPLDPAAVAGQTSPLVFESERRSSFAARDETFGALPTASKFGSFSTSLPGPVFASGPTFPPQFPTTPGPAPAIAPSQPPAAAIASQRPTTPPAWKDVTPEWMPAVRPNAASRSKPWHGKTVRVSAKEHAVPRNAVERLELFRALYPSLHFALKQTPGDGYDLDLRQTYDSAMKQWKEVLRKTRTEASPNDPLQHTSAGLPEIRQPWFDYLEDWDVAGRDQQVQQRILTNWNHPARDIWKAQRCPLNFHSTWTAKPESRQFLDNHNQLIELGLPNFVSFAVDNDGILQIQHMSHKSD